MTDEQIWNDNEPIGERFDGLDVPRWIEDDISPYDVAAIYQGGCNSGAYMPAVTYSTAQETMNRHGDDVFSFIEDRLGEVPFPKAQLSWSGLAVHFVSLAVELWATGAYDVLENDN